MLTPLYTVWFERSDELFWETKSVVRKQRTSGVQDSEILPADALLLFFLRPMPSHLCVFLHWIISLPFTLKRNSSARQSCFSMTHQTKHGRLNHPKKAQWQAWRLSWSRALAEFIFISVVLNGKHRWLVIRGVPAEPPCLRVTEEISTAQSLICWIFQVVQCRVFKLCTSTLHSG